jgi:hypothetical protein
MADLRGFGFDESQHLFGVPLVTGFPGFPNMVDLSERLLRAEGHRLAPFSPVTVPSLLAPSDYGWEMRRHGSYPQRSRLVFLDGASALGPVPSTGFLSSGFL